MEQPGSLPHQKDLKAVYIHTDDVHNMTAPHEVMPIIMNLVNPRSVLDVGCGTGTWLKAFNEAGITDYLGVDGDYVDSSQLKIPIEKFIAKDLRRSWNLNRKFDLVISLEVAEHLPEDCADQFIETLVSHTDNAIIFSAAIPGQGGQNHLNEQWPEYWQKKFLKHGFHFHDEIRPLIWGNEKVDWWYRQNIFLVNKVSNDGAVNYLSLVHPELLKKCNESYRESFLSGKQGLNVSSSVFLNALVYKLKSLLGSRVT